MTTLTIALEEGFESSRVVVRVNDVTHFDQNDVSTRLQIGLAERFEVDIDEGPVVVDVALPEIGVSTRITLQTEAEKHLGISLTDGAITYRVSDQPFGYV